MVFPVLQQPRDSYLLWHIFTYPTSSGPIKAIAVPDSWRDKITALYTLLLSGIFAWSWIAFVATFYRQDKSRSNAVVLRFIFHEQDGLKIFFWWINGKEWAKKVWKFLCRTNYHRPGSADKPHKQKIFGLLDILWLFAAILAWLLPIGAKPSLFHLFVIGKAAPANPNALYFPRLWDYSGPNVIPESTNFFKQPILRALSVEQLQDPAILNRVQLDQQTFATRSDGQKVLRYDYGYSITSWEFGMQHFAGLSLVVNGSCYTEYGWIHPENGSDTYHLWDDSSKSVTVKQDDVVVPRAWFSRNGSYDLGGSSNLATNTTYAIWVSTAGHYSFAPGTDPWYFTAVVSNNSNITSGTTWNYRVESQRPVLSCWETSGFAYNDVLTGDPWYFIYNHPELNFPNSTRSLFYGLLWQPSIITTGQSLDTINLASSEQDIEFSYDANASSIYQDLQRMLVTSYVWTTNILLDTSIRPANTALLNPNFIGNDNRTQIADFVVYSPDIATLSLAFVLVVPCLAVVIYAINIWATYGLDDEEEGEEEETVAEKIQRSDGGKQEGKAGEQVQAEDA